MATAYAKQVDGTLSTTPQGFEITYQFHYVGSDVGAGGSDISEGQVTFAWDDTAGAMAAAVGDACRAEADRLGFTVEPEGVVLTSFAKA